MDGEHAELLPTLEDWHSFLDDTLYPAGLRLAGSLELGHGGDGTEGTTNHPITFLPMAWLKHLPGKVPLSLSPGLTSWADLESLKNRLVSAT